MRRGDARDLEGRNNRGSDPFAPALEEEKEKKRRGVVEILAGYTLLLNQRKNSEKIFDTIFLTSFEEKFRVRKKSRIVTSSSITLEAP